LPDHPNPRSIVSRLHAIGAHQIQLSDNNGNVMAETVANSNWTSAKPDLCRFQVNTFQRGIATQLRYYRMIHEPTEAIFDFANVPLP
jgi:hypothetical protein